MGGLVVKEAYIQGQHDPAYETIIKAVSSIIFLSTPHRGTNLAETLNRILQVSFVTSPMQFIAELAVGSHTLQKLNESFRHAAPKLQIVSFYETRPTPILMKSQTVGGSIRTSSSTRLADDWAHRWFWRRTLRYSGTLERYRNLSMPTIMEYANMKVAMTLAISQCETC